MKPNFAVYCLLSLSLLAFGSCSDGAFEDPIPLAFVDIEINLNNQQYLNLQFDGQFVFELGGVRGIILYRENASTYKAFERNCTFQPLNACATVDVHNSGLFMIDSCCGSTFDFNGFPTGPPASIPLREYTTRLEGNILRITSE